MATPKGRWLLVFLLYCCYLPLIDGEGFTFPTNDNNIFRVGDVVNVTWSVIAARISLYQVCNSALTLKSKYLQGPGCQWHDLRTRTMSLRYSAM